MHRVKNYGSSLQAYALVEYIKRLGHHVEIIDYVFPNSYHLKKSIPSWKDRLKLKLRETMRSILLELFLQRNRKFKMFRESHMSLSLKKFNSKEELSSFPPVYDIYITGSDQVWNESKIFEDNSFFCNFAPRDKKIVSFGASITTNKITEEYRNRLKAQLDKYSAIGVREKSSITVVDSLGLEGGGPVLNTCDPTLLLDSSDYDKLAKESKVRINEDYILVHQLEYNFSAEPAITEVIDSAKKHFGCGAIWIDHMFKRVATGDRKLCNLGPVEFVWLFKNAKAVVTSSFHGTMFSIIYRKPFVSVAPPKEHLDSRIADTLNIMGLTNHLIYNDGGHHNVLWYQEYSDEQELLIQKYINKSKSFLKESIG